jgi:superfamily I DNA/RNA helicase
MVFESKERDYLSVLAAIRELPFGVGKKLLADFLIGEDNPTIKKYRLDRLPSYGSLAYSKEELSEMMERLIANRLLEVVPSKENKFMKLLSISEKGRLELETPSGIGNSHKTKMMRLKKREITERDRQIFLEFGDFLRDYNDEQKVAIVSDSQAILCIAGAGSGKTTVLTKRIEFLVRYRSVEPKKILAITFTRKARGEMQERLKAIGALEEVNVETFNSFCEKVLLKFNSVAYEQRFRVIGYRDKLGIIAHALSNVDKSIDEALNIYFTQGQMNGKTREQLISIFVNDCFFIRDYTKSKAVGLERLFSGYKLEDRNSSVGLVYFISGFIERFMIEGGLRDYADQLMDCLRLFREHSEVIPDFSHILIDEYQDVNSSQMELVDLLNPENIFAVGDPRQSIFGWRGSDIRFIAGFEEKYLGCETIALTKNYRSTEYIVNLINKAIGWMRLPDLESAKSGKKDISLVGFESESEELGYVVQKVLASELPREEIFVLARTNRQLTELSMLMRERGIKHIVRSDEINRNVVAGRDEITLATIHAIKGMEAELVFVVGCSSQNFPCRGSEHPIIDMIKLEEYDKEEEEKRLFYVAMSRAKQALHLSYSGKNHSYFISEEMKKLIGRKETVLSSFQAPGFKLSEKASRVAEALKEWRGEKSKKLRVSPLMVLQERTILEIAERLPVDVEELEGIFGLGSLKIRKYGEEIVEIVKG